MPARLPRPDQFEALVARRPEGALYMLNLLKFRDRASYADGRQTDLSGEQAYMIYAEEVQAIIEGFGGAIEFGGRANVLLIGDDPLEWDWVALVRYPSFQHFVDMTQGEAYQAIHVHREAGLDHQILLNCLDPAQSLAALNASG
jgi:uncharacterized protein (DUF1330 family)